MPVGSRRSVHLVVLPRNLVAGQRLTWIGRRLPPPARDLVQPGDMGVFVDYEGDRDHYVVEFNGAMFCCAASDVRAEPRPAAPEKRTHKGT